ncbi:phosphatidylinositol mannoside acyltransferase [Actinomycetospora corticicola]|uniref:KDO2-lipid IV(A) lauroyltransferase n=1 Tax=Actinomycetospora corticicola TaxID=663602 RepID=A0A7Y9DV54_9PSEU|nr:KDO2-lipid IV(A) lauroyltransferase [Actinomycetospora corticicola]
MTWSERAADLGYAAGWQVVRGLPEPVARGLFDLGADVAAHRGGRGVERLRANYSRVRPDLDDHALDELTRAGVRSYARYWREAFRLPAMNPKALADEVDDAVVGREHLDAALAAGRGAIVPLTHSGNWDVVGTWAVQRYGGFATVAERLRPESLFQRFVAYRESLGFEILPMTGGEAPVRGLLRALRAGRIVCLVADRDLSHHGVGVDFFGHRAAMPPGPASLAAATGAPLLPLGCWFTDRGWAFRINPPITVPSRAEVPAATQAVADVFAREIAEHPQDWHMLQRIWPDLS